MAIKFIPRNFDRTEEDDFKLNVVNRRFWKSIPAARILDYSNAGWTQINKEHNGLVTMERKLQVHSLRAFDEHDDLFHGIRRVWLVQRATIRRPLGQYEGLPLSEAICLDYMGSAEFEYGAYPAALRRIQVQFPLYKVHKVESIKKEINGNLHVLRVFANFDTDAERDAYFDTLKLISSGEHQLKDDVWFFPEPGNSYQESVDCWIDIDAGIVMSFDRIFMNRVSSHLQASFALLDSKVANAQALADNEPSTTGG